MVELKNEVFKNTVITDVLYMNCIRLYAQPYSTTPLELRVE
jgi:hypothetical protein